MARPVPADLEDALTANRAARDRFWAMPAEQKDAALAAMGFFDPSDEIVTADRVLEHFRAATGWFSEDRAFTIDRGYVRQVFIDVSDPRSRFFEISFPSCAITIGCPSRTRRAPRERKMTYEDRTCHVAIVETAMIAPVTE